MYGTILAYTKKWFKLYDNITDLFFGYPREMLLRIPAGGTAGYVGLALFKGYSTLKHAFFGIFLQETSENC